MLVYVWNFCRLSLQFQLAGRYVGASIELKMIKEEHAKLTNDLLSLFKLLNFADLSFKKFQMSLKRFKHYALCIFQEVHGRLEGLSSFAMVHKNHKIDFHTGDPGSSKCNTYHGISSTTYWTNNFESWTSPNLTFVSISPPPTDIYGNQHIPSTLSNSRILFQDSSTSSFRSLRELPRSVVTREELYRVFYSFGLSLLSSFEHLADDFVTESLVYSWQSESRCKPLT